MLLFGEVADGDCSCCCCWLVVIGVDCMLINSATRQYYTMIRTTLHSALLVTAPVDSRIWIRHRHTERATEEKRNPTGQQRFRHGEGENETSRFRERKEKSDEERETHTVYPVLFRSIPCVSVMAVVFCVLCVGLSWPGLHCTALHCCTLTWHCTGDSLNNKRTTNQDKQQNKRKQEGREGKGEGREERRGGETADCYT